MRQDVLLHHLAYAVAHLIVGFVEILAIAHDLPSEITTCCRSHGNQAETARRIAPACDTRPPMCRNAHEPVPARLTNSVILTARTRRHQSQNGQKKSLIEGFLMTGQFLSVQGGLVKDRRAQLPELARKAAGLAQSDQYKTLNPGLFARQGHGPAYCRPQTPAHHPWARHGQYG